MHNSSMVLLCLPSCGPGFESQSHHLYFLIYIFEIETVIVIEKRIDKNEQKRGRIKKYFWKIQK